MSMTTQIRDVLQRSGSLADATHPDNFVVVDVAFFPADPSTEPQHSGSRFISGCAPHGPSVALIASTLRRASCDTPALPWSRINCHGYRICGKDRLTTTTSIQSSTAFRVRDRSGKPAGLSSGRGLEADSPTALHLNAGMPTLGLRSRWTIDKLSFYSPEFEGIGNAAGRNSELSEHG